MYVLGELWRGSIVPMESRCFSREGYKRLLKALTEAEDVLFSDMTEQQLRIYTEADDIKSDMNALQTEEAFVTGFRLGARVMIDVMMSADA